MANDSLSKSTPKLNLTRRQAFLFQKIILAGNQMAEMLSQLEVKVIQPKAAVKLTRRWAMLMVQLAKMLI